MRPLGNKASGEPDIELSATRTTALTSLQRRQATTLPSTHHESAQMFRGTKGTRGQMYPREHLAFLGPKGLIAAGSQGVPASLHRATFLPQGLTLTRNVHLAHAS